MNPTYSNYIAHRLAEDWRFQVFPPCFLEDCVQHENQTLSSCSYTTESSIVVQTSFLHTEPILVLVVPLESFPLPLLTHSINGLNVYLCPITSHKGPQASNKDTPYKVNQRSGCWECLNDRKIGKIIGSIHSQSPHPAPEKRSE
jgi:hypothetical protein